MITCFFLENHEAFSAHDVFGDHDDTIRYDTQAQAHTHL